MGERFPSRTWPVLGASEGADGVQRIWLGVLEILEDDRRLEDHAVPDLQHRHLAEGRELQEPVGLGVEVDVDALEGHPFSASAMAARCT